MRRSSLPRLPSGDGQSDTSFQGSAPAMCGPSQNSHQENLHSARKAADRGKAMQSGTCGGHPSALQPEELREKSLPVRPRMLSKLANRAACDPAFATVGDFHLFRMACTSGLVGQASHQAIKFASATSSRRDRSFQNKPDGLRQTSSGSPPSCRVHATNEVPPRLLSVMVTDPRRCCRSQFTLVGGKVVSATVAFQFRSMHHTVLHLAYVRQLLLWIPVKGNSQIMRTFLQRVSRSCLL